MSENTKVPDQKPAVKSRAVLPQVQKPAASTDANTLADYILSLQQTAGNAVVQKMFKSGTLQAKLRLVHRGDKYEQEADKVAEQIVQMGEPAIHPASARKEAVQPNPMTARMTPLIQKQAVEKEEEEVQLQASQPTARTPGVSSDLSSGIESLKGGGQPLPEGTRAFMEQRFGYDFSRVRVHTDNHAAETVQALKANALTTGQEIAFGAGQYSLQTAQGQKLLAHELTHVVQQNKLGESFIQCDSPKGSKEKVFDFKKSEIAIKIKKGLKKTTTPSYDPKIKPKPIVDYEKVLEILSSSTQFIGIAKEVEEDYFPESGDPRRTPPLEFLFHVSPALGSEFERRKSLIKVEVTNLADVVQRIVHEVVHASHAAPKPKAETKGVGEVTRIEEAGIKEESSTRDTENQIMKEIQASEAWKTNLSGTDIPPSATKEKEIRNEFVSGLPKLTYQEFIIVEEMKNRNQVAGVNEETARPIARSMLSTHLTLTAINKASVSRFQVNVEEHQKIVDQEKPVKPLYGFDEYEDCITKKKDTSPSCKYCLETYRGYFRTPIYDKTARRALYFNIERDWEIRYKEALEYRRTSEDFISWYDSVKKEDKKKALEYFEWVLIGEAMSDDWGGKTSPDAETRGDHLDFLKETIGKGLRGISRP